MLYMVLDESKDKYYVKVGMSRNIPQRKAQYLSHSPSVIFLSSCAGTENEEINAHSFLKQHSLKGSPSNEWNLVSKDFYEECLKKGMAIIPKCSKKKIYWHYKGENDNE